MIYNDIKNPSLIHGVINPFGMPTKERYNPRTVERVAKSLENGGHTVKVINGNKQVIEELEVFMPKVMAKERHGMVFNMAYGIQGQSRYTHIPAMLEMLGVPYVGSGPSAHALALDKVIAKIIFKTNNLPTPEFWVFNSSSEVSNDLGIKFPVIAKPKMEAVSYGLTICDSLDELKDATEKILDEFQQQVLVEQFIIGREFAVGILGNRKPEIFPPVEFDFSGDPFGFQSLNNKMKQPITKVCPSDIFPEKEKELKNLALNAFRALNISDFGRIDFRMDDKGQLYILELNSMASLGLTGSYVHAAKVAGYSYESLVNRMLDVAAYRYFGEEYSTDSESKTIGKTKVKFSSQIRSYLRGHSTTMEAYLEKLVRLNTYVYNPNGVNQAGDWLSSKLTQFGFHRKVYPQVEVGNILYFANHKRKMNDILILAHFDNIYDYADYLPFRSERGRIYGSGVAQSKGGIAVFLGALHALRFTRQLKKIRVGILLTSDDCLNGRISHKIVTNQLNKSKFAIELKSGGKVGGVVSSCDGTVNYQIVYSELDSQNSGKRIDLAKFVSGKIRSWYKLTNKEEGVSIIVQDLGIKQNPGVKTPIAQLNLVLYYKKQYQYEPLHEQIKVIAEKNTKNGLIVNLSQLSKRPPLHSTERNLQFFDEVKNLSLELETRIQTFHRSSSSDIGFSPNETPSMGGFGPAGGNYPSEMEYIVAESLIDRAALLAITMKYCADHQQEIKPK